MKKRLVLVLSFFLVFGSARTQSIDSLRFDFIQWRISEFLKSDCRISNSIRIEDFFEQWNSEKKFVENYLKPKNQNQLEAMWSKDKESYEILDSLRSILESGDYSEIEKQLLPSTDERYSGLGKLYKCDGKGQPIVFKITKPIVLTRSNIVIVTEIVYYQNNNCSTKQITSYKRIDSNWIEFLNFFRSNVCI